MEVSDCYFTGNVSGTEKYVGGVVGYILSGSSVSNCYFTGDASGMSHVGGVVGKTGGRGSVFNCHAIGSVTNTLNLYDGDVYVGGVVGDVSVDDTISNCYFTGDVSGNGWYVGGVAGCISLRSSVFNCYSTGSVSGNDHVGGVAGYNAGTVSNCYALGDVNGSDFVGGVVGIVVGYDATVSDCYSIGNISGNDYVGGVAGYVDFYAEVSDCYSTGDVSGNDHVGGVAGRIYKSDLSNCYSIGDVNGNDYVGGVVGYISDLNVFIYKNVSNCYSLGDISGNDYVGGVVGFASVDTVSNCYATGDVSGKNYVGGVAGRAGNNSCIQNSAALNPSVQGTGSYVGRAVGDISSTGVVSNNIAWDKMLNRAGNTNWSNIGADNRGGANISKVTVNADDTLGGRFITPIWTTQKGYLPGLFGNAVIMPKHLRLSGVVYILTLSLPNGKVSTSYSATLTAEGSTPITWSIESGSLPDGLSLNATSGTISGTPSTVGTSNFVVKAINNEDEDSKKLSITIEATATPPVITTATLPNGTISVAYQRQLTATGSMATWTIESGNLPDGLTLNASGTISGTPTKDGVFNFTVKAENTAGSDTKELSISIAKDVGIEQLVVTSYKLQVYPNPTNGQLKITNYELRESTTIEVYNVMGQKLLFFESLKSTETTIDVSHLAKGMYFLKVGNQVVRFVRE